MFQKDENLKHDRILTFNSLLYCMEICLSCPKDNNPYWWRRIFALYQPVQAYNVNSTRNLYVAFNRGVSSYVALLTSYKMTPSNLFGTVQ